MIKEYDILRCYVFRFNEFEIYWILSAEIIIILWLLPEIESKSTGFSTKLSSKQAVCVHDSVQSNTNLSRSLFRFIAHYIQLHNICPLITVKTKSMVTPKSQQLGWINSSRKICALSLKSGGISKPTFPQYGNQS